MDPLGKTIPSFGGPAKRITNRLVRSHGNGRLNTSLTDDPLNTSDILFEAFTAAFSNPRADPQKSGKIPSCHEVWRNLSSVMRIASKEWLRSSGRLPEKAIW